MLTIRICQEIKQTYGNKNEKDMIKPKLILIMAIILLLHY